MVFEVCVVAPENVVRRDEFCEKDRFEKMRHNFSLFSIKKRG
jgi:hypothetical protein